ncbi:MAG: Jag N-terminal domain-containing protein [Fretibacterium sp.]|nr:Jag N-terminal domain-containing protein [Fretibacterium sp.]
MSFEEKERQEQQEQQEQKEQKLLLEVGSVEEAIAAASEQWGISSEYLRTDVVGSDRGFLGLFGKKLKVEVVPTKPLAFLRGVDFVNRLLSLMGFEAEAALREDEIIDISGKDAADYIVVRYGDCLKAIEYLVNLALRDLGADPRVRLDSCGYRERRTRSLERLAEATARQALEYGRPIRLEPMLSWERWVIHTTLKDREDVRTESVGEPPLRKVVVMPKFDASNMDGNYRSRPPRRGPRSPRGGFSGGPRRSSGPRGGSYDGPREGGSDPRSGLPGGPRGGSYDGPRRSSGPRRRY